MKKLLIACCILLAGCAAEASPSKYVEWQSLGKLAYSNVYRIQVDNHTCVVVAARGNYESSIDCFPSEGNTQ